MKYLSNILTNCLTKWNKKIAIQISPSMQLLSYYCATNVTEARDGMQLNEKWDQEDLL